MRPTRFGVFGYPFGGEARERPLVAGWILAMLGFFAPPLAVIAVVPILGYVVRVIDASAGGRAAPTVGGDLPTLLRQGLAGTVVTVVYLAVPLAALLVTIYGAVTTVDGTDLTAAEQLLVYGGGTAVLLLFATACFLVPAALAVYADEESLRSSFSPSRLRPLAGHAAYFSRWTAGAVTFGMAVSFASLTLQIRAAGPIVASLLLVYGAFIAAHVWGLGVRYARER